MPHIAFYVGDQVAAILYLLLPISSIFGVKIRISSLMCVIKFIILGTLDKFTPKLLNSEKFDIFQAISNVRDYLLINQMFGELCDTRD